MRWKDSITIRQVEKRGHSHEEDETKMRPSIRRGEKWCVGGLMRKSENEVKSTEASTSQGNLDFTSSSKV
jgi:hypothetical protein